ncbi:hypothetical protein B0H14DRAFT_3853701 [Mycena olivaceomarginata]|nr:hypothetical protein B0H14DRAFT_3853701 [Mycena olivaceomarginata]
MLDLRDSTYFPRAVDLAEVGNDEHHTIRFFTGPMTEPEQSIYRTMHSDKKIHWCFTVTVGGFSRFNRNVAVSNTGPHLDVAVPSRHPPYPSPYGEDKTVLCRDLEANNIIRHDPGRAPNPPSHPHPHTI